MFELHSVPFNILVTTHSFEIQQKFSGKGEDICEENAKFVTESLQSRFDPTVA